MKNKQYMKLLAVVTAMAICATTVTSGAYTFTSYAAETTAQEEAVKAAGITDSDKKSAAPMKDETVYAKVNATGKVKEVVVSDQLKNYDKGQIKDVSSLTDIENVKGDEKNTHLGDSLIWEGTGDDIVYQGKTEAELPVSVKISYQLDGRDISAKDLVGKSGKLTIRYEYDNTSKVGDVYTPFLMTTAMILDTDKYSDVTTTNGKVISDGSRDIVVGMGLPKMAESLGVEDKEIDIPDYFEMTANVSDYEALDAVTVATNDLFSSMDDADFQDLDTLKNSMTQLQDASNTLVDGSNSLSDGLDQLMEKSGEMVSGVNQLSSGGQQLASGTEEFAKQLKTLKSGVKDLNNGVNDLKAGVDEAKNGADTAVAGGNKLAAGAKQVADGTASGGTLDNGVTSLESGMETAANNLNTATQKTNGAVQEIDTAIGNLDSNNLNDAAAIEALKQAKDYLNNSSTGVTAIQSGVSTSLQSGGKLNSGAEAIKTGIGTVHVGAQALYNGITGELNPGLAKLQAGLAKLNGGASQLQEGGKKLASGSNSAVNASDTLAAGAKTLNDGLDTLKDGSGQLVTGVEQLDSGSAKLSDGMVEFNETGINKLVDVFNNDVDGLLGKLDKIIDVSKEYKNFSGINSETDGSVKFIFITEE